LDFLESKKTSQEAANNKARECKKKRRQSLVGAQLKLLILRQGVVLERQRKHDPIMMARKAWETSP